MIKRRLCETPATRSTPKQNRAMMLKVITHNLMIVLQAWAFYRALLAPSSAGKAGDAARQVAAVPEPDT